MRNNEYTTMGDEPPRNKIMSFLQTHRTAFIGIAIATVVLVVVIIAVILAVTLSRKELPHVSSVGFYSHAAVATDHASCSELGKNILLSNGTAVDAAIGSMFCTCIFNFQSCGIGGGFFMVVYQKPRSGSQMVMKEINCRETAPLKATADMYNETSSTKGAMSIAVPGDVKGRYLAWKEFGRLPWKDLIDPTINWLKNGFPVSKNLARVLAKSEEHIKSDNEFSKLFVKPDGTLVKEGDMVKMPKLAVTLEKIATDPEDFYSGQMADDIAKDIQERGGIITTEDLGKYEAQMKDAYNATIPGIGLTFHSMAPPGSGPVLALMLKIIDVINMSSDDLRDIKSKGNVYHRITEAMKFGFAEKTYLGDDRFIDVTEALANVSSKDFVEGLVSRITLDSTHPIEYYNPATKSSMDDKGTAHLSVMAPDGSAVAMTGTLNLGFGSGVIGSRTGILFNDEMNDFTIPNNRPTYGIGNLIEPGKRPMSSMIPSIYTDSQGKVKFVIGASGGPVITSSNFFAMTHRLWLNYTIEDAVNMPRFHNQLIPNKITYEKDFNPAIVDELRKKGHDIVMADRKFHVSVIQVIENKCDPEIGLVKECLTAISDWRKLGKPAGF